MRERCRGTLHSHMCSYTQLQEEKQLLRFCHEFDIYEFNFCEIFLTISSHNSIYCLSLH